MARACAGPHPTLPPKRGRVGWGWGPPRVLPLVQMFANNAHRSWRWPAASRDSRSSSNGTSVNANLLWTVRGRDKWRMRCECALKGEVASPITPGREIPGRPEGFLIRVFGSADVEVS